MVSSFSEAAAAKAFVLRQTPGTTLVVVFTVLGCASRLRNLHHPATPIYDETHVGRFLNWYHDGTFFFDVHGPLAKLLIYWTSSALGFAGRASCPYESPQPYGAECSMAPQRLVPALCGACMVPLTFATCCAMRLHPLAALLCSWLVLVDTLFIGVARVHLNDMVQMLFIALTHLFAIYACAPPPPPPATTTATRHAAAATADGGKVRSSIITLAATGFSLGCALQCKYAMALTTLAWLGLQNLLHLGNVAFVTRGFGRLRRLVWESLLRAVLLLGIPLLLHLLLLRLHLSYVPRSGNGDNYMSVAFQSSLVGNQHREATPAHLRPSFLALAYEHAQAQFWYNRNMAIVFPRGSHPFDTPWHTWPLAARGIYFSLIGDWGGVAQRIGDKHAFGIYLHPNPMTVLLTSAVAAAAFVLLVCRVARVLRPCLASSRRAERWRSLVNSLCPGGSGSLVVAYLLHWLPYATQDRQTFLLYYLPAYYFSVLLLGRMWHECACALLRPSVALLGTIALGVAVGHVSWSIAPIAYGSEVRVHEWTAALRLASTECWRFPLGPLGEQTCWADARATA